MPRPSTRRGREAGTPSGRGGTEDSAEEAGRVWAGGGAGLANLLLGEALFSKGYLKSPHRCLNLVQPLWKIMWRDIIHFIIHLSCDPAISLTAINARKTPACLPGLEPFFWEKLCLQRGN